MSISSRRLFTSNGSPRSNSIYVYVFVCVLVFIWTFNRHIGTLAAKWETFVDFLNTWTGRWFCRNKLHCSNNWISGLWLGLLGAFIMSSNFWTLFLHPIVFKRNLRRRPRWLISFLVYDFSSFHLVSLRNTKSWECVVKDDCVQSCLIELISFLLRKFDVDPIHSVLMFLPLLLMVPCKTRCFQVNFVRISVFFVHRIHRREEYRLSFAQIVSSGYQSWFHDGV